MNCCKPGQVGTKEHGKMMKRIQTLGDGRILAKKARNWKTDGQKRRITREEYRRLWNEMRPKREDSWPRKDCGTLPERCPTKKETSLESTGRRCHEENVLSSRLREDGEERIMDIDKETKEDRSVWILFWRRPVTSLVKGEDFGELWFFLGVIC